MIPAIRRWSIVLLTSATLAILFYLYLHFSEKAFFPKLQDRALAFIAAAISGIVTGITVHLANRTLDRILTWKRFFAARFFAGFLTTMVLMLAAIAACSIAAARVLPPDVFWDQFSLDDADLSLKTAILSGFLSFIYCIVYALQYSYQHYASAQIESLRNERRQLELQFEALKGQVSPHYLFNSLNTISSLLFKDLPTAEQFIRRLAQTYQYILSTQDKKYVLLKEEVDFVNSYYYLLRIRFQQQLDVEINLPPRIMNSKIPPLTLQMLVENAVKHNNLTGEKKLFIYITAQDNKYLRIINTKTSAADSVSSFRVGLENIRRRYEFLTDAAISIRDDEKFSVSLPVIDNIEAGQKHSA